MNSPAILTIQHPKNKKLKRTVTIDNHRNEESLIEQIKIIQKDFEKLTDDAEKLKKTLCASSCCNGLSWTCIFSCLKKDIEERNEITPKRPMP